MLDNYKTNKGTGKSREQLEANNNRLKYILSSNIDQLTNDICNKIKKINEFAKEILKLIKNQWKIVVAIQGLSSSDAISSFYEYINYKLQLQAFQSETDLLVLLPVSKKVLFVEVKAGSKRGELKKSAQQTKKRVKFLTKAFVPRNWSVIKASCCPKLDQETLDGICDYCNQFFISYGYVSYLITFHIFSTYNIVF